MDLIFVMLSALGPGPYRRRGGVSPPAHPASGYTLLAGALVGLIAVPGAVLVWGGWKLASKPNDMLAPVIGIVGIGVIFVGAVIVLHAAFAAVGLWARNPAAYVSALVVGVILALFGPLLGAVASNWLAAALFGYAALLVGLLCTPQVRADFPSPLSAFAPRERRSPWFAGKRRNG